MMQNSWLKELVGCSYNAKSKHMAESYLWEEKQKFFGGIGIPKLAENLLMCVLDSGNKSPEILDIGGNVPSDLILNNVGELWKHLWRPVAAVNISTGTLFDSSGASGVLTLYNRGVSATYNNSFVGARGTRMQIGSGSSSAARTDFSVQTAFANTGPEDSPQSTSTAVYSSATGKITFAASVFPAAGSGTVREAVVFGIWSFLNGEVALTRDIISPGVSFSPGQNITANYTWQL